MKRTVQPDARQASRTDEPKRSRTPQQQTAAPGGRLAQLAAMMNGSPRGQRLAQLKDDIQSSPRVQSLMDLAQETNQLQPIQRIQGHAVVQRQGEEAEETDAGADLQKTITALKELVKAGGGSETASELQTYIEELEEIEEGGDSSLKSLAMKSLDEEARAKGEGSLGELVSVGVSAKPESGKEVVQGNFIYDWLTHMAGYAVSNPRTVATVAVVLAAAFVLIRAERKRKRLPLAPSAVLFNSNRHQYWAYLGRFIETYCKTNKVTANDLQNLKSAMTAAISQAHDENNFKYVRYPGEAANKNWNDMRFKSANFVHQNIFTPFDQGVVVVAAKSIQATNVSPQDRAGFTASLKKLPYVKMLYAGKVLGGKGVSAKKARNTGKVRADWKAGGSIKSKIREVDDGWSYLTRDRGEVDNGNFAKKVKEADYFIRRTVEPAVLRTMPPPGVAVHLRNASGPTLPWGFRAFQSAGEIHVAQNEPLNIIIHEIGHYVENNLPMEKWADIQLLLHARQGGERNAGYIYPWTFDEQRFTGDYPATGAYTSKYYESGSTEVMSKSVEYLAHPSKFRTLIENDPQQAAVILRLLRPMEFNKHLGKNQYVQKYLPR